MNMFVRLPTEYGEIWINPDHVVTVSHGDLETTYKTHSYVTLTAQGMVTVTLPVLELLDRMAITNGERSHLDRELNPS